MKLFLLYFALWNQAALENYTWELLWEILLTLLSLPLLIGTGWDSGEKEKPWISALKTRCWEVNRNWLEDLCCQCSLNTNIFRNSLECKDTKKEFSNMLTSPLKGQTNTMWNLTETCSLAPAPPCIPKLEGRWQRSMEQLTLSRPMQSAVSKGGVKQARMFFSSLPAHLVYCQGQAVPLLVCLVIFT